MRKATIIAIAFEIHCPKCKEILAHPDSGSLMWEGNDIRSGQSVACSSCKTESVVSVPQYARTG